MERCDECDKKLGKTVYEVRRRRPSDRFDLCCIVVLCKRCGSRQAGINEESGEGCATGAEWTRFVEERGVELGLLWLT